MAFIGRLDLTVPDILQFLSLSKKTGKLRLSRLGNMGEIVFKNGKVVYAVSDSTRNTLGNILINQKHLTEKALMAALEVQHLSPDNKRLGAILVEKGVITPAVLQEAIRHQIEQVISEFLTWESGFFRFDHAEVQTDDAIMIDANDFLAKAGISSEHLLLEGVRRLDERNHVQKPPRPKPEVAPPPPPDLPAAAHIDEQPVVEKPSRPRPEGTPPSPPDLPAAGRLDEQPVVEKPSRPRPEVAPPSPPDLPAAGRLDEQLVVEKPLRLKPEVAPPSPPDLPAAARLDEQPVVEKPSRPRPAVTPPPPPDLPAGPRLDERREARKPARATPRGTGTPPPSPDPLVGGWLDEPHEAEESHPASPGGTPPPSPHPEATAASKPWIRKGRGEQPDSSPPLSSHPEPEAPLQEGQSPSITDQIMFDSPVAPWVLIMHFAADVVGRGILFFARNDGITGHDQFGVDVVTEFGDEGVHNIKIPLTEPSIFSEISNRRKMYRGKIGPGKWNDYFLDRLGGNKPHEAVVIPIIVAGNVVAIFYGDDAGTGKPLGEVERLEALIGQTFLAIEMSLLEKRSEAPA